MAKKNVLVKSEVRKNLADSAGFLRELADKIESGQVTLTQGGKDVLVNLPETVSFELEYYQQPKKGAVKHQLEIELQWREGGKKHEDLTLG